MSYYEAVYIVHPALQEGRLHDIVDKFHNKLKEFKGKVLYINNWGKKKLAYPIDKQKYGTYVLCQYSLDGKSIKNISQELELNPNILRYLITKIDESKILEGPNKLVIKEYGTQNENQDTSKQKTIEPAQEKFKDSKNKEDASNEEDNSSDLENKEDASNEEDNSSESENKKEPSEEEDNSSDSENK